MAIGIGFMHALFAPHFAGLGTAVPMMFMWLIPLLVIVWAVTAASERRVITPGCGPAQPVAYDPALGIVRERYARGEIDRAQYEQLVAGLIGRG